MNWILIYLAIKYNGDFDMIFQALKDNEEVSYEDLTKTKVKLINDELKTITLLDDNYPDSFKELKKPPFVLFYQGDLELLGDNFRKMLLTGEKLDKYSEKYLKNLLSESSISFVPILNANSEFEIEVVKRFTQKQWPLIVFTSKQMTNSWHYLNYDKLLLISQYPPDIENTTKRILETNKIASVLSDKLWVFSSDENNYVMRLVKEFKKLKKTIFCFQDGKGELGNKRFLNKNSNLIEEITFTKIED